MININLYDKKWFKSPLINKYQFLNENLIGLKAVQDIEEYNPWDSYLDLDKGKKKDTPLHKEFIDIGQYACGEKNYKSLTSDEKEYFNYKNQITELEKKLNHLDVDPDKEDNEAKRDEIIIKRDQTLEQLIKWKKIYDIRIKEKILNWVNKFGLPYSLYDEADKIYLSPQFLPYEYEDILLKHKFQKNIEFVDPEYSIIKQQNNKAFIVEKVIDNKKWLFLSPAEYNIIKSIEKKVKFFPGDIDNLYSKYGQLCIGLFQPYYHKVQNIWKLKFNNISLLSEMTLRAGNTPQWIVNDYIKKNKKEILKKINKIDFKSVILNNSELEKRIPDQKEFKECYIFNPKFKNPGAYKQDEDEKLVKVNSNFDSETLKKIPLLPLPPDFEYNDPNLKFKTKNYMSFVIENYQNIINKSVQFYKLYKLGIEIQASNELTDLNEKKRYEEKQRSFNELLSFLTRGNSETLILKKKNYSKHYVDKNFLSNSLYGVMAEMVKNDFINPDKFPVMCQYDKCKKIFFAFKKKNKFCCKAHATTVRMRKTREKEKIENFKLKFKKKIKKK